MDYNKINNYLSSLEIDNNDNKIINKKNNLTMLDREINLNANAIKNI